MVDGHVVMIFRAILNDIGLMQKVRRDCARHKTSDSPQFSDETRSLSVSKMSGEKMQSTLATFWDRLITVQTDRYSIQNEMLVVCCLSRRERARGAICLHLINRANTSY